MIKLKDLLKESHVWERKFGEKLPTLADVQQKYNEGCKGSGPHKNGNGDEDNPFDREPSDDEMADIEKEFEGVNEAKKIDSKTWKKMKYQIEDQIDDLVKIGEDYGVFQSAQYTAKTLKKIQKKWKSL